MSCLVSDPRVPFREHGDLRLQVVAGLKVRFLLVLFVDAFVVGANAGDAIRLRYSSSEPAKPVNTVMPASSTLLPSHFTKLVDGDRHSCRGRAEAAA